MNSTLIRGPFGYERFNTVAQTLAINQLYDMMWVYYNFFQPVMRTHEKVISSTKDGGSKVKRRYDQARTPLDRLCATDVLSQTQKDRLLTLREQTYPSNLRQAIYDRIDAIFYLPGANDGIHEDIFQTLAQPIQIPKGADVSVTLLFDSITLHGVE